MWVGDRKQGIYNWWPYARTSQQNCIVVNALMLYLLKHPEAFISNVQLQIQKRSIPDGIVLHTT